MSTSKIDVLLGLQWGDEGKGKVVDVLTPKYDVVARFQGGPNAGHTLEFEGQKYVLRSIPSGIFQGGKVNIIGNGVVLAPDLFMELRLVIRHRFHGSTKYEACYDNNSHSHQICTVCGKVTEIDSPEISEVIDNLHLKRFRKDGFTLYIYGICSICQAKLTRQKNLVKKEVKNDHKK